MRTPRKPFAPVLIGLALAAAVLSWAGQAAQDAPNPPAAKPAVAAPAAEVAPPAMTPKEKTGVYVFLAWTWLTIGVLLYILRLKVREADRVVQTGFFATSGGGKKRREP